ncbi:MAG: DoxX family protein [Patescibacteria group bacterium]|nr:DoxX family protein [Patescibacteria group bacterium]
MKTLSRYQEASIFVLRVLLGWLFFYAGITKVLNASWSAAGFLESAKTFGGFYAFLTHPLLIGLINVFNEWGLTLLGLSLIFGFWIKWSAPLGAALMLLYYFASNSLPIVPNGFLIDQHIIYAAVLVVCYFFRAGEFWGIDGWRTAKSLTG